MAKYTKSKRKYGSGKGRRSPYNKSGGRNRKRSGGSYKKKYVKKTVRKWSKTKVGGGMKNGQSTAKFSAYRQKYVRKIPRGFKQLVAPRVTSWIAEQKQFTLSGKQSSFFMTTSNSALGVNNVLLNSVMLTDIRTNLLADEPALVAGTNTMRYWIDYVKTSCRMKNQSNRDLRIRLYDITPKRDIQTGVVTDPIKSWISGLSENYHNARPAQYDSHIEIPGVEPTQSPEFCQNFTVLKRSEFVLQEGKEHVHQIFLSPRYPMSDQIRKDYIWYKGLSVFTLVVVHGGIVIDKSDAKVTLSSGDLHIITQGKMKYGAVAKNRAIFTHYGGVDTNVWLTNQEGIDDMTHAKTGTITVDPAPQGFDGGT